MNFTRVANFLFEVGSLRKLPRAHKQTLTTEDPTDNISSHSFRVAVIGYFLAKAEKADAHKVLLMCLFHDVPETRSGDQNWVHKKYVKVFEDEIIADQFTGIVDDNQLLELVTEYGKRESQEAKLAKDADLIEQILLLREHAQAGNKEAEAWLNGQEQAKRVVTQSGKNLVEQIYQTKVKGWWADLWTADRR